jgi:hypothetical protein
MFIGACSHQALVDVSKLPGCQASVALLEMRKAPDGDAAGLDAV